MNFLRKSTAYSKKTFAVYNFFTPWALVIATAVTALIFFKQSTIGEAASLQELIETLLQVNSIVFGINVIGLTINRSRESDWKTASSILKEIRDCTSILFSMHDHPNTSKLQRRKFINYECRIARVKELKFSSVDDKTDYYVYRKLWDGVWYQTSVSPFADILPNARGWPIQTLHEIVICAYRLLCTITEMRESGCCLLSEERGTQGTKLFLANLRKTCERTEAIQQRGLPTAIDMSEASRIISLGLYSTHYLSEEFGEQSGEPNWEPANLARFSCFYVETARWLTHMTRKLQQLRLANANARGWYSYEQMTDSTKARLGFEMLDKTTHCLNELSSTVMAEFGAAYRSSELKAAAIPGLGWAIGFLILTVTALPILQFWGDQTHASAIVIIIYFFGLNAFLESINFVSKLIRSPKIKVPFGTYSSRPPT